MKTSKEIKLTSIDASGDDVMDVLESLEKSIGVRLTDEVVRNIETIGDLIVQLKAAMKGSPVNDCSSQHAFYKLRKSIQDTMRLSQTDITPQKSLEALIPRKNRIKNINKIKQDLGFGLNALKHSTFVDFFINILLLLAFALLPFQWKFTLFGLLFAFTLKKITRRFAKEFKFSNLGELSKNVVLQSYTKVRRNSNTYNDTEIDEIVMKAFSEYFILMDYED